MNLPKVFVPTYNEAELAAIKRSQEVADATRLDDDEEDALKDATTEDLMTLAEILGSNPQEFIMEAYADPLKGGGNISENIFSQILLPKQGIR